MSPTLQIWSAIPDSVDYDSHGIPRNPILFRDLSTAIFVGFEFVNNLLSQIVWIFRIEIRVSINAFSMRAWRVAMLALHVLHVFVMSCQEKVMRITTPLVIAPVTNTKTLRNLAVNIFPDNSMGKPYLTPDSEHAISSAGPCPGPFPTLLNAFCFFDFRPKPFTHSFVSPVNIGSLFSIFRMCHTSELLHSQGNVK